MEYNKSLSARIKRRNKQGFKGVGSYNGVGPYHEYDNYNNPAYNHKSYDLEMVKRINRAKKLGYKHPGSKPYSVLKYATD